MSRGLVIGLLACSWVSPAFGQPMDHSMHMPEPAPAAAGAGAPPVTDPEAAPPPTVTDNAADRYYAGPAMARARDILAQEHGGERHAQLMANLLEYQGGSGHDGYRWDLEAWYGGDLNRLVVKSQGEGARGEVEAAELQALYSRAVGPYTDLQVGVRHDFQPHPTRTYLTAGAETLLPYWLEVQGAFFLSDHGDLLARAEGSYDLRLTQRLVLQPRAELEFAAQDVPETGVGSGLSSAELGLRLRYEIRREFAPYVGLSWSRLFGDAADFARGAGEDVRSTRFVAGLRAWF